MGSAFSKSTGSDPQRTSSSQQDVLIQALKSNPGNPELYHRLGALLSPDDTIVLHDGRRFTRRQLLIEGLRCDPVNASLLVSLGNCLSPKETIQLSDGRTVCDKDLYKEALRVINAGDEVVRVDEVTGGDPLAGSRELYIEAIQHAPNEHAAYFKLAVCMAPTESITLPGNRTVTKRELYLDVIRLHPSSAVALNNLANILPNPHDTIRLPDGRNMNKPQLYVESLRHDPTNAVAYFNLAKILSSDDETVVLADGRHITSKELYVEALHFDPSSVPALINLAVLLRRDEPVTLRDGRVVNSKTLYMEAIRYDSRNFVVYANLACSLSASEKVTLPSGETMDKRRLFVEALRFNSHDAETYYNLAVELREEERIALADGRCVTKQQLFVEALRCDASLVHAFYGLSQTLSGNDKVHLADGREMSHADCLIELYRINPEGAIKSVLEHRLRHTSLYFTLAEEDAPPEGPFECTEKTDSLLDRLEARRPWLRGCIVGVPGDNTRCIRRGCKFINCGFVTGSYCLAADVGEPAAGEVVPVLKKDITLEEVVGEGGFGVVWRAKYLQRVVAVKQPHFRIDSKVQDRAFERELQTLRFLPPHDNVVRFIGLAVDDDRDTADSSRAWLVMEYIDGAPLSAVVAGTQDLDKVQRVRLAVNVGLQVCAALVHMHAKHAYHLDLKPQNVLLTRPDSSGARQAKLCDFGLSRVYDGASHCLSREAGTPNYAAPEQYDGGVGTLSAHTDVYGVGGLLWFTFTGEAPWKGYSLIQIVTAMQRGQRCPSPLQAYPYCGCPPQLDDLIDRMMALTTRGRPPLEEVMLTMRSLL